MNGVFQRWKRKKRRGGQKKEKEKERGKKKKKQQRPVIFHPRISQTSERSRFSSPLSRREIGAEHGW